MEAKRHKPVVASFGDVAASGGYLAAVGCHAIFSNIYTITGSIGVIAGFPVIKRLLAKIDVTSDYLETIPNAAWRHAELGLPEGEMAKLRAHIDKTYQSFKDVVSIGRKMTMEDVEKRAQGQVYTGAQALELGLVDELGGLMETIKFAGRTWDGNKELTMKLIRELLIGEKTGQVEDMIDGGEMSFNAIQAALEDRVDDPGVIRKLFDNRTIKVEPEINVVVIPPINAANEVLGIAIGAAFQSDDERSPIPVDQPISGTGDGGSENRFVMGALLGIARTNNIPLWQFPMFCYWYAAQGVGGIRQDNGVMGALLNSWFGKLLNDQSLNVAGRGSQVFAKKESAWDIRMEMAPFEIYF